MLKLDSPRKWLQLLVAFPFAIFVIYNGILAWASVWPVKGTLQTPYCDTVADMTAWPGHPGMTMTVGSGTTSKIYHLLLPSAIPTATAPHAYAGINGQWVDDYALGQPISTAQLPLIYNAHIATSAAIAVTKLETGPSGKFLVGTGTNMWLYMTDGLHQNLGGGSLHATANASNAGFIPAVGSAGTFPQSSGSSISWTQVPPTSIVPGAASATTLLGSNGTTNSFAAPSAWGLQPNQDWHSTLPTSADHAGVTYFNSASGIDLVYESVGNSITIQQNYPVPFWSVPVVGSVTPTVLTSGRGIDFYDAGGGGVAIETNWDPFAELTLTNISGTTWLHKFHRDATAPAGATTNVVLTEATWRGDATKIPGDNPGTVTASITLRVIGRDQGSADAVDYAYRGTIQFIRANNQWSNSVTFAKDAYLSLGTGTDISAGLSLGGTRNGTLTFAVTNSGTPSHPSDASVIIDIVGGGKYDS